MGFKIAQEIGDNNNAEEVIQALLNDRKGFKELLKENELSGDWLILVTKMLTKICDTSFIESKIKIFQTVFVHSTYPKQLTSFISNLPNHDEREKKRNEYFWNESDQFWNNLIIIFEDVVKLPSFASQNLPVLLKAIHRTLLVIEEEHGLHIADEIKEKFVMLLEKVQSMESEFVKRCEETQSSHNEYNDEEDNVDPPNDFREINVYPNIDEVTVKETPFLRKNKAKGAYKGIYHYLDVQFRLLREDFIAPFRNGICQYLNNPEQRRFDDVKIYNKVHFLSNESVNELNCIRIKYDFSNKKRNFIYENSKLFMYGSLVCFSKNHFKNVIFGRIVKRDVELLKKGELVVGFDEMEDIVFNTDYIMIESTVYFEPYFHVLRALQRMCLYYFPMEKYIIYAEKVASPPNYLDEFVSYNVDGAELYPLSWPNGASHYGLNDSQQAAFRAALTQEIAVIQGPPGTGKTFTGLKITQTLLKNTTVWDERGPILVICYTNHALDQFLEGILPFTEALLRIGGQSKNENLNNYNLRNSRVQRKSEALYQTRRDLEIWLGNLKSIDNEFENILNYDSIINFSCFDVLPHYRNSPIRHFTRKDIRSWLLAEVNGGVEETDTMLPTLNVALPMVLNSSKADSGDEINSEFDDWEEEAFIIESERDEANLVPLITLRGIQLKIYQLECKLEEFVQTLLGVVGESLEETILERDYFNYTGHTTTYRYTG
ncbi:hypothetical protein NQ318_023279 [Aromia moschata]|uniref:DNA2/NAM7 helicase helicase domain-containing protein n=1 Tax=Aromia moschata TaxID=1265417 RepID=A0AAV8Y5T8_9CUCU|nr:hypothetical protein NQ318_023279 [Aromia moschata]